MRNLEFSELLNSISYSVSSFETKSSENVKNCFWKVLREQILKNQTFLCVKNWSKTFNNVPDVNLGLHSVSALELKKESNGRILVRETSDTPVFDFKLFERVRLSNIA